MLPMAYSSLARDELMALRILITAPNPKKFDTVVVHGELVYLGEHLHFAGYKVDIDDGFSIGRQYIDRNRVASFCPDILVVDLFRNELLEKGGLERILDSVEELKEKHRISSVIAIGSISSSLREEILAYSSEIDWIVDSNAMHSRFKASPYPEVSECIKNFYNGFRTLSASFLESIELRLPADAIMSLAASSGCPRRCSFCSYNAHVSTWRPREIRDLADEVEYFWDRHGIRRFALTDNNFGIDPIQNKDRLNLMGLCFREKSINPKLSMNINAEGLSREVVEAMVNAGVDTILIGLESFNISTLRKIYNKYIDFETALPLISVAENAGIQPVISFILFHPWLTLEELRSEIRAIELFGRHRLIQFAANSILRVVPRTRIEQRLDRERLLIKRHFSRAFRFVDGEVGAIYQQVADWTMNALRCCRTDADISNAKIDEWNLLKRLALV